MKFAIKDKVISKEMLKANTSFPVMEVVGFLNGAVLTVDWGSGYDSELRHYDYLDKETPGDRDWRRAVERWQEDQLLTPEEAQAHLKVLAAHASKLEAEFEAVRGAVKEKLNQAALLVKDAAALVEPTGKDFYDMPGECKELFLALNGGGWSHSTMRCKYGR